MALADLLISLLKHADRVCGASLAQLVNVIAPIMTEPGGIAWRQSTFFPFALTAALATGSTISTRVESDSYDAAPHGEVPLISATATHDEELGRVSVFVVNRSTEGPVTLDIDLDGLGPVVGATAQTLADDGPRAANTLAAPERVGVAENPTLRVQGRAASIELPPVSWSVVTFSTGHDAAN